MTCCYSRLFTQLPTFSVCLLCVYQVTTVSSAGDTKWEAVVPATSSHTGQRTVVHCSGGILFPVLRQTDALWGRCRHPHSQSRTAAKINLISETLRIKSKVKERVCYKTRVHSRDTTIQFQNLCSFHYCFLPSFIRLNIQIFTGFILFAGLP